MLSCPGATTLVGFAPMLELWAHEPRDIDMHMRSTTSLTLSSASRGRWSRISMGSVSPAMTVKG